MTIRRFSVDSEGRARVGYQRNSGVSQAPYFSPDLVAGPAGSALVEDSNVNPDLFLLCTAQLVWDIPGGNQNHLTAQCLQGVRVTEGSDVDLSPTVGLPDGTIVVPCAATGWTQYHTTLGSDERWWFYKILKYDSSTFLGRMNVAGSVFTFLEPCVPSTTGGVGDNAVMDYAGLAALADATSPTPPANGFATPGPSEPYYSNLGDPAFYWTAADKADMTGPPTTVVAGVAFPFTFKVRKLRDGTFPASVGDVPVGAISLVGYPQSTTPTADYDSDYADQTEIGAGEWVVPNVKIFRAGLHRLAVAPLNSPDIWYSDPVLVVPAAPTKMRLGVRDFGNPLTPVTGGPLKNSFPTPDGTEIWNQRTVIGQAKPSQLVSRVVSSTYFGVRLQDQYSNDCGPECPDTTLLISLADSSPGTSSVPGRVGPRPPITGVHVSTTTPGGTPIDTGREEDNLYAAAPGKLWQVLLSGPGVGASTFEAHVQFSTSTGLPADGKVVVVFPALDPPGLLSPALLVAVKVGGVLAPDFAMTSTPGVSPIVITRDDSGLFLPAGSQIEVVLSPVGFPSVSGLSAVAHGGLAVFDVTNLWGLSKTFSVHVDGTGLTTLVVPVRPYPTLRVDMPATCAAGATITVTATLLDFQGNVVQGSALDLIRLSNDSHMNGHFTGTGTSSPAPSGVATFTGSFPSAGTFRLFAFSTGTHYDDPGWLGPQIEVTP